MNKEEYKIGDWVVAYNDGGNGLNMKVDHIVKLLPIAGSYSNLTGNNLDSSILMFVVQAPDHKQSHFKIKNSAIKRLATQDEIPIEFRQELLEICEIF